MIVSPPTILCVGLPPAFRERLQDLFVADGKAAVHTASPSTALAAAQQTTARCCLVAASVLGESRMALLAELQVLCPVLLLTDASGPPTWLPTAYAAGLTEHLAANASTPELLARIGRYLSASKVDGVSAALGDGPSSAAVARLAGGVAHDMNNILAVLVGAVGLLRGAERRAPEVERVADILNSGSERGAVVVSQLLAFAESLKNPPQLLDLVEATPSMLTKHPANIQLQSTATGRALVEVAPAQLAGILDGLLATVARQYPDGAEVAVDTQAAVLEVAEDEVPWVTLRIAAHPVASKPYSHLSDVAARPRVRPTAGLGYAIAQTTVEQLGGRLLADAGADGSLTYEIQLPAAALADGQQHVITPPDLAEPRGTAPTSLASDDSGVAASATATGQGVLIVAADPLSRRLLADALEVLGIAVVAASAPREALQTLRDERDSVAQLLLVVDPAAPPAPSWLGALRSARPGLRLVLGMAAIDATISDQALRLGAAATLRLPLDLTECEAALRI